MLTFKNNDIDGRDTKYAIGLDLDGTSGAFHKSFRDVLITHQGFDHRHVPVRTPAIYSYVESGVFDDMDVFLKALFAATGQGVYRTMEPYKGFRKHLTNLVENGAYVKVITSRPDDALDDTLTWLNDVARVPYHEVFITDEKTKVAADVYIDDKPGHILNFQEVGSNAIIYDQPYNRDVDAPRATAWSQIPALVNDALR